MTVLPIICIHQASTCPDCKEESLRYDPINDQLCCHECNSDFDVSTLREHLESAQDRFNMLTNFINLTEEMTK